VNDGVASSARRPRRRKGLLGVRAVSVLAASAPLLAIFGDDVIDSLARQMTYPAPPVAVPSPPPDPLEEVVLATSSGALGAWWLPPRGQGALVLMLHGNGENLETMRQSGLFEDLAALGAGVLAIDYPGYGRSAGEPSETSLLEAADVAWRWLSDPSRRSQGTPLVVMGWSLGAGVAAQVAARHADSVDAAIFLSPWDSLHGVAVRFFPSFLVRLLSDRYDSVSAASLVRCPTLVLHGERDDIIPVELGRRLFDALPEPKRWVAVENAGHNDLLDRELTWSEVADFLAATRRSR
jgi:pimeloyl-ACP methyl ester carboxylesterase